MRTLLISKEFAPYSPSGGIGTYTRILSAALADNGVETHVLCVDPGLGRATEIRDGAHVHTGPYSQLRGVGRLTRMPATWGRLSQAYSVWREYRRLGIDFDVVESPELYAESLALALAHRVPLVVRLHSGAAQLFPLLGRTGPDAKATIALEHAAARRADLVVSTAPHLRHAIGALGLDSAFTREIIYPIRLRAAAPDPPDAPIVLFVGRLERQKGPETVVDAAPYVLEKIPDARFRFVGEDTGSPGTPSYREELESLAARGGVADAIEFAGACPPEAVFEEMAAATVCAFPSQGETFGNVAAEAASIGRPVVVSDIPAFRDYVEDGVSGRIAPCDDGPAWGAALADILLDRERGRAMGMALRESIRRRAAPDVVASLVIESHEAAIERFKTSRGT